MIEFGEGLQKDLVKIRLVIQPLKNNNRMMDLISRILVLINNNEKPDYIMNMIRKYAEAMLYKVENRNEMHFIQMVMKAFYTNVDKDANIIRL